MSVCLDAYAILCWLQDEPGSALVEEFLERAGRDSGFFCYLSIFNLGEVFYRLWRVQGADRAESFWGDVLRGHVPLTLVDATPVRVREAARLKGQYPIAYADAFAAQTAVEKELALVTGDPEFEPMERAGLVAVHWLPPGKSKERRGRAR